MHSDLYRIILLHSFRRSAIDLSLSLVNRRRAQGRREKQVYVCTYLRLEGKTKEQRRQEEKIEMGKGRKDKMYIYTSISLVTSPPCYLALLFLRQSPAATPFLFPCFVETFVTKESPRAFSL